MLGMRWGQDETGQPPAHGALGALAGSSWWVCLEEMEEQGQLSCGRWGGDISPASPALSGWAPTTQDLRQQKSHPMGTGWGIPARGKGDPSKRSSLGWPGTGWVLCGVERL